MNGRYLNTAIILASLRLGLNQVFDQKIFLILWIISTSATCSIVAMSLLQYLILNYKTIILTTAAVAIRFVNVFMMELILFPEMSMGLMVGSLCLGLAIYFSLLNPHKLIVWVIWIYRYICHICMCRFFLKRKE